MSQNTHQHRPLMVQAPVRALDPDGVAVVTTGTIGFAVGAVVCWWLSPELAVVGKQWYFWVSVTGTVIGLLGLAFGLFRKTRRNQGRPVPAGNDPAVVEMIVDQGAGEPGTDTSVRAEDPSHTG